MKNTKQEKGITLIALVITIIVMLILVAVSITMAVNGGLFNYAKDAATQTNTKMEEENKLATGIVNVEGKGEMDINAIVEEYTAEQDSKVKSLIVRYNLYDGGEFTIKYKENTKWKDWIKSTYAEDAINSFIEDYENNNPGIEVEDAYFLVGNEEYPEATDFDLLINGVGLAYKMSDLDSYYCCILNERDEIHGVNNIYLDDFVGAGSSYSFWDI